MAGQQMTERDPRVDPRPGDVLRDTFRADSTVVHVSGSIITRVKDGARTNVGLQYWRAWYRDATIIRRAEEEPQQVKEDRVQQALDELGEIRRRLLFAERYMPALCGSAQSRMVTYRLKKREKEIMDKLETGDSQ